MSSKKVVVIGAGPAGLACAVSLARRRVEVTVLEAAPYLGGMSRTLTLWGQRVDLGPHRFFTKVGRVERFWKEFVGDQFRVIDRLTRIYFNGRFFRYPLQPLDVVLNLGPLRSIAAIGSYARERLGTRGQPVTLEDFLIQRFGKRLYQTFFKGYSEKLWGVPCSRIDANWAAQRIGSFSMSEAIRSAILPVRAGSHKTLLNRFQYPDGGSGVVYERMAAELTRLGGRIELNTRALQIGIGARGGIETVCTSNGAKIRATDVVSTMPIPSLIQALTDAPDSIRDRATRIRFRNTILVYLELDCASVFPDNWVYVHSRDVVHGRVTNFRNWGPSLHQGQATTILCMEFWSDEEGLWKTSDLALEELAAAEIRRTGLIANHCRILKRHVVRISKSYPIYDLGFVDHLRPMQEYVSSRRGLLAIGRAGSFKYNNQDHSLLMGLVAADEIVSGKPQGLWELNSDSDYQEESSAPSPLTDAG